MDEFAAVAREFLGVKEGDYYWDEYDSGLDHFDAQSISEIARHFYLKGKDAAHAQGVREGLERAAKVVEQYSNYRTATERAICEVNHEPGCECTPGERDEIAAEIRKHPQEDQKP